MTTSDDNPTTRALRGLDPADREIDQAQRTRATATLERILATDPDEPTNVATPAGEPRRRRYRLLLAGGVVVAAVSAALAVPTISQQGEAFASWSPEPVALTGDRRTAVTDACLTRQGTLQDGELAFDPRADASVLVAEARGGWSYILFRVTGASGFELEGSCLMSEEIVADPESGEGGDFGSLSRADDMGRPPPARDVAREDSYGVGVVDDEAFVYAEGSAGADVVGIEVTTPGGLVVEASVARGRWAVWWPAGDDSMDNPELTGAPTYEVTLRDGTVIDGVRNPG